MKKERIKFVAKVIGGIVVAFAVSEIVLRLLGFPSINTNTFDKNNLVIFKPDGQFLVKDRCYASTLVTNDQGFHSANYSIQKPAGTFRIAVIGDSFVEAVQMPLEKTFTSILEKKLNEAALQSGSGVKYEVIPIGKSGNGTLANLVYAREYAMQFKPDLVVDAFITNDLQDDMSAVATLHAVSAGVAFDPSSLYFSAPATGGKLVLFFKHFVLERSLLFERLWMNLVVVKNQIAQSQTKPAEPSEPRIDSFVEAQLMPQTEASADMWANEEKSLKTFDDFVTGNGAKFLLVHLAEGYLIDPSELSSRYYLSPEQAARFQPDLAEQKLAGIASRAGFPFFSTEPFFAKEYKSTGNLPVLSCDNHYNELGHEWAAEALFEYLTDPATHLLPRMRP